MTPPSGWSPALYLLHKQEWPVVIQLTAGHVIDHRVVSQSHGASPPPDGITVVVQIGVHVRADGCHETWRHIGGRIQLLV